MSIAFGIEVSRGPFEFGAVRFKFGLSAEAALSEGASLEWSGTASPGHDRTHGGRRMLTGHSSSIGSDVEIAHNITLGADVEPDTERLDRLIANPTPAAFAFALLSGFNPHVRFNGDAVSLEVDVQADIDFCFFGVRVQFDHTALRTRSLEGTGQIEGAMLIGPSRRTMQQLALRAGPSLTRVLGRALPRVLPEGGALASSGFFSTWAGPIGWAIPLALGTRDALVAYTDHLRSRGADRGRANQWAAAFVREAYGQPHPTYTGANAAVARQGIEAARSLAAGHGWVQIQARLENEFNGGQPPRLSSGSSTRYDRHDLEALWFRLGESVFRSRDGGGPLPETLERF